MMATAAGGGIIHVADSLGGLHGSCGLGQFEKLEKLQEPPQPEE